MSLPDFAKENLHKDNVPERTTTPQVTATKEDIHAPSEAGSRAKHVKDIATLAQKHATDVDSPPVVSNKRRSVAHVIEPNPAPAAKFLATRPSDFKLKESDNQRVDMEATQSENDPARKIEHESSDSGVKVYETPRVQCYECKMSFIDEKEFLTHHMVSADASSVR
jgi:hypothetical protein